MSHVSSSTASAPPLTSAWQSDHSVLARKRLLLGITNVGTWVVAASIGLWWITTGRADALQLDHLLVLLAAGVLCQGVFDWIGGIALFTPRRPAVAEFLRVWMRATLLHAGIVVCFGLLTILSIRGTGHPTTAVIISMAWLALGRELLLRVMTGARIEGSALGLELVRFAHVSDPGFTGGPTVLHQDNPPLLPASWLERASLSGLQTERTRREWQNFRGLPRRSWLILVVWNVLGASLGWFLFGLGALPLPAALLGHACAMTLWGFIGLLLLPSLSRSSVFAADHAASMMGQDVRSWLRQFPQLTGEDGSPNPVVQKIFYPIPSAEERSRQLNDPTTGWLFGGVARDNLFYSWSTLSFLGRAVHCNAGRPALWVYPPST